VHSPSSNRPRARPRSVPADYDRDLQEAIKRSLTEGRQGSSSWTSSEPPSVEHAARTQLSEEDDPDLRAAIQASLREAHKPRPSEPTFAEEQPSHQFHQPYAYQPTTQEPEVPRRNQFVLPNYDLATNEADAVLSFNQAVEYAETNGSFSGRQSQDVSQLFDKASRVRPKIAMSLDDTHRKHRMDKCF
jgi:growth factor-regulated tyrosine kinase substrate